jgi:hypothetical protein
MTTILPPPTIDDWTGPYDPVETSLGVYFADVGGAAVTLTVPDLMPGHTLTVALDIIPTAYAGASPVATIGDTPITGIVDMERQTITATVTVGHELQCTLSGFGELTICGVTLTDAATVPDQPVPGQVLALFGFLPILGLETFRLGTSRLGRDALTAGVSPTSVFVLGRDKLGTVRLVKPADTYEWRDLLPDATAVETTRGVSAAGPILTAQVGTLTATAWDAWDPRATGLHHGTEIHLIHWPTRTRAFTGIVTDIKTTPQRPDARHSYQSQITASDAVAILASTTRHGAKGSTTDGTETWTARIASLMASTTVPYKIASTSTATMCPTVWETSLAKHLDAACASVAGAWNLNPHGIAIIRATLPTDDPSITLTDTQTTDLNNDVWSYTAIDDAWAASDAITRIEATTHTAALDDYSTWQSDDTTTTVENATGIYTWGGSSTTVDLTVPALNLTAAATRLLRRVPDAPAPATVTLAPAHTHGPADRAQHMARAAALDILDVAEVTRRSETSTVLITTIAHTITPTAWTTTLGLTDRSTR